MSPSPNRVELTKESSPVAAAAGIKRLTAVIAAIGAAVVTVYYGGDTLREWLSSTCPWVVEHLSALLE